jgi:peptidoglycan/xylan/chitin deacetylase (PgdA/CDA1 family)
MKFKYYMVFAILLMAHVAAGIAYSGYQWWWLLVTLVFLLAILAAACRQITWNFFVESTNRLPLSLAQLRDNTRPIALTFDDGPTENTLKVLDILKKENIKAAFFVIGKQIPGYEEILKRIEEEGHLIGNHTYSHEAKFYLQSANKMTADIQACNEEIARVVGYAPNIFRPPFGVTNPTLAKALRIMELQCVGWSLRSYDTMAKDGKSLLQKILKQAKMNDIILLHDRCDITVAILPELISGLREKGFSFTFPVKMVAQQ